MNILLVDDDASSFLPRLNVYGKEKERHFIGATNETEARKQLVENAIDCIFMDGHLGFDKPDGPSIVRSLRASGVTLPIYMVSSEEEKQVAGVKSGANGSIDKMDMLRGNYEI